MELIGTGILLAIGFYLTPFILAFLVGVFALVVGVILSIFNIKVKNKVYQKKINHEMILLNECIINNQFIKENSKVYTLTKDGLVLNGKGYATYNYKDSINLLTTTTQFSKYKEYNFIDKEQNQLML